MSAEPVVAIITVQYNNFPDTIQLAKSLGRLDDASQCELIVVDNAPGIPAQEAELQLAALTTSRVKVLTSGANLFYWGGANYAIDSLYRSKNVWPQWIIICNNDVTFDSSDFIRILESLDATTHPIVAPTIVSDMTGKDQNPLLSTTPRRMTRLKWQALDSGYWIAQMLLGAQRAAKKLAASFVTTKPLSTHRAATRIHAPHGACVILSSAFFSRGGSLDTRLRLFGEELTIALTARKLGLPVWHIPELKVVHREHSTTGSELTREKYEMERQARRRYFSELSS